MATNRPNPPKGATNIKNIQIAEPTGFLPGFTFLGPGKGASAAIGDYLEEKLPEETIGSQALKFIAKGIGSGIGEGLDFVAEPFVGLDKLLGLPAIGSGKEIEDIKKSQLKLAPQARQQDPSGDMGFGIISPDIFDPKFAPKDSKFAPTFPSEDSQLTMDDD